MRCRIIKDFRFEAAQTLPNLPSSHKCTQMHGHSFKVEIAVEGQVDPHIGWVYDHAEISKAMKPLMDLLDHAYLNDIEGLVILILIELIISGSFNFCGNSLETSLLIML